MKLIAEIEKSKLDNNTKKIMITSFLEKILKMR